MDAIWHISAYGDVVAKSLSEYHGLVDCLLGRMRMREGRGGEREYICCVGDREHR